MAVSRSRGFWDFIRYPNAKRSTGKPVVTKSKKTTLVPKAWMPNAKMNRVIVHWTAGSHTASSLDREHYHALIEGSGKLVRGHHAISDNIPPLREGQYAAHTRKANSYSIGISFCSMAGAKSRPLSAGKYPLNQKQWDSGVRAIAEMCQHYGIKVTDKTVLTHAEVQLNLKIRQNGKWDISWLPFWRKSLSARAVGDKLRAEVSALV